MKQKLKPTNKKRCCGSCAYFKDEDINGIGICKFKDKIKYCDNSCRNYLKKQRQ